MRDALLPAEPDSSRTGGAPAARRAPVHARNPGARRPAFRPRTGLPDLDSASFSAEQHFETLLAVGQRCGAVLKWNAARPPGRYEVEVPPLGHHALVFSLGGRRAVWDVAVAGRRAMMAARPDQFMVFPAGADLSIRAEGGDRMLHVHLDPAWFEELAAEAGLPGGAPMPMAEVEDAQMTPLLRGIAASRSAPQPCAALICEHATVLIALQLLDLLGRQRAPRRYRIPPAKMRAVTSYVEEHLARSLSVAELSSVARLSLYHFARAFRQETGATPHGYVMQRRVERAKLLMLDRQASLAGVAVACGFTHQAHFTTVFRRLVGTTPGAWRTDRLA